MCGLGIYWQYHDLFLKCQSTKNASLDWRVSGACTITVTAVCCVFGSLIGVGVCQRRKHDDVDDDNALWSLAVRAPPAAMVFWVDPAHSDELMK